MYNRPMDISRGMRRWAWATLVGILSLAMVMRLAPLLHYSVWGSDTGEYYVLTEKLVEGGALSTDYNGWGFGYPYFPGMFVLTGGVVDLCGTPLFGTLLAVAPLVACLSVLALFIIGVLSFGDGRAGLFAAAYLSVCTPHVFATSHPMPGAIGDFLALLCILLLLKGIEKPAILPALALVTPALVLTHHLSTFFVIVPVLIALLGREVLRVKTDTSRTTIEAGYLSFIMGLSIVYWFGYAVPFRERVISEAFGTSPWLILGLAPLPIIFLPLIVGLRRKLLPHLRYRPAFPSLKRVSANYALFAAGGTLVMAGAALLSAPGTSIDVNENAIVWFLPQVYLLGIAIAGVGWAEYSREGLFILLWLGAIGLTFIIATATENHVLMPYRQTQYMMEPLALFAGAGAVFIHDHLNPDGRRHRALAAATALTAGIVLVGATSYPPREVMGGFEEGTVEEELAAAIWLKDGKGSWDLLATDHRMSSICFGIAGINGSWDDAYMTLHGNLSEAAQELESLEVPSGRRSVDLVLLSPSIIRGAALVQWENAEPISGDALAKFETPVFVKIYDAAGVKVYYTDFSALSALETGE